MILSYTFSARTCARILAWGVVLYHFGFASADGDFTDGLYTSEQSMFNEDIDPPPGTSSYLLDPTNSGLISDMYFNDESSDEFDDLLPSDSDSASGSYVDSDSDSYQGSESGSDLGLFASSAADSNSILDTTTSNTVAECSSFINGDNVLRKNKKARVRLRRETACKNPYSNSDTPILSLPTLDPSNNREDLSRPVSNHDKTVQDNINDFFSRGGPFLGGANAMLKICPPSEKKVCSSNDRHDIHRESEGGGYTLTSSTMGKYSLNLYARFPSVYVQCLTHESRVASANICRRRIVGDWEACFFSQWGFCCKYYISAIEVAEGCQPFEV